MRDGIRPDPPAVQAALRRLAEQRRRAVTSISRRGLVCVEGHEPPIRVVARDLDMPPGEHLVARVALALDLLWPQLSERRRRRLLALDAPELLEWVAAEMRRVGLEIAFEEGVAA